MKRIIKIWKTIAKTSGGYGALKERDPGKRNLIMVMLALAAVLIGSVIYRSCFDLFTMIEGYAIDDYVFNLFISSVGAVILLYGVFDFMSVFYFADDLKWYQHLPIKPYVTIAVKFGIIYSHQCVVAFMLVPLFLSYGVFSGYTIVYGLGYGLFSIVFIVLVPIMPCTLSGILAMLLMRFSTLAKRKDLFKLVVGIISVSLGLGFNIVIRNVLNANALSKLVDGYSKTSSATGHKILGVMMTPYKVFIGHLVGQNFAGMFYGVIIMFLTTSICVVIMLLIGNKIYLRGTIGLDETPVKKKKAGHVKRPKVSGKRNSLLAVFIKKELKGIIRDPSLIVQYIVTPLILPAYFVFMTISSRGALPFFTADISNFAFAGGTIFIGFIIFLSPVYITGISREGKGYYVNKFLPIEREIYYAGKMLVSLLIGCELVIILMGVLIYMQIGFTLVIAFMLSTFALLSLAVLVGFNIERENPQLEWNNMNELFKRNPNIWAMFFFYVLVAILVFIIGVILNACHVENILIYSLIIFAISMCFSVIFYGKLKRKSIES